MPVNRRVLINLDAISENYRLLAQKSYPARCAAVVKANAYGLGVAPVAHTLAQAGCDVFFVATVDEAIHLRSVLAEADIYLLEGIDRTAVTELKQSRIIPVLNSTQQAQLWAAAHTGAEAAPCILHLDSGMSRLGMDATDVARLKVSDGTVDKLSIKYVMTHLACADEPGHGYNTEQLARFTQLRNLLPPHRVSIANSAGIFLTPAFHGDLVRAGIALFGGNPQPSNPNPMQEVVHMCGRIIQLREIREPIAVGYGATVRVNQTARLATVALGYADGYPRCLGNQAKAVVNGSLVPVIGRVSMDSLVLDVSAMPHEAAAMDEWVSLIGGGVELDKLSAMAGTISYELLTGIGPRVRRIYTSKRALPGNLETNVAQPVDSTSNYVTGHDRTHSIGCS